MDLINIITTYPLPIILLLAWLLDLCLGDPMWLPHPVVYMGKWIAWGEKRLNRGENRKAKGAIFAVVSIIGIGMMTWLGFRFLRQCMALENGACPVSTILYILISSILLFFCLAGHTLRAEVRMVFEALERGLEDGRKQVARIVGRDTAELSAQEVRTAALETLAENLSDGVIAPLFWFMILGVPGAMAYKMINTLDSMIGYKDEKYKDFGCWAAHIDDVANYIPARVTALLILVAAWINPKMRDLASLRFVIKYGPQHASPNSGWPEAALASILDCRFGGPHNYFGKEVYKPFIGDNPRQLTFDDMQKSITICMVAEIISVVIILILFYIC